MVEALLRQGAGANDTLPSGATLLDAAASVGAANAVRVLLNHNADPNGQGRNGRTPLEEVSLRGFCAIAEMLLDHGARVNEVNTESGTTALYAAAGFGKGDVVKLLLQRGAHPNACGKGRTTPYKAARDNGFLDIAAQIQNYGGSTACKTEGTGIH
jgi:ankyrin repeat protein